MRILFISLLLSSSLWATLEPVRCYELVEVGRGIIISNPAPDQFIINVGGLPLPVKLVSRAKCIDCNEDVFETISQPLTRLTFKGKRSDISNPYSESGTLDGESYVRIKCPKEILRDLTI